MSLIESLKDVILSGGEISEEQAYALCDEAATDREALYESAKEITAKFGPRRFDSCSIINARSGKCPENCKWCAQSAHFKTKVENYPLISRQECMRQAEYNHRQGIRHISQADPRRTGSCLPLFQGYGEVGGCRPLRLYGSAQ